MAICLGLADGFSRVAVIVTSSCLEAFDICRHRCVSRNLVHVEAAVGLQGISVSALILNGSASTA